MLVLSEYYRPRPQPLSRKAVSLCCVEMSVSLAGLWACGRLCPISWEYLADHPDSPTTSSARARSLAARRPEAVAVAVAVVARGAASGGRGVTVPAEAMASQSCMHLRARVTIYQQRRGPAPPVPHSQIATVPLISDRTFIKWRACFPSSSLLRIPASRVWPRQCTIESAQSVAEAMACPCRGRPFVRPEALGARTLSGGVGGGGDVRAMCPSARQRTRPRHASAPVSGQRRGPGAGHEAEVMS